MQTPEIYRAPYPFKWSTFGFGDYEHETWVPGVNWEERASRRSPHYDPETYAECDGIGEIEITVVSRYKPPGFRERVFYTRQWIDPDGKRFGAGKLFCVTGPTFNRRKKGWWIPVPYELSDLGKTLLEDAA